MPFYRIVFVILWLASFCTSHLPSFSFPTSIILFGSKVTFPLISLPITLSPLHSYSASLVISPCESILTILEIFTCSTDLLLYPMANSCMIFEFVFQNLLLGYVYMNLEKCLSHVEWMIKKKERTTWNSYMCTGMSSTHFFFHCLPLTLSVYVSNFTFHPVFFF